MPAIERLSGDKYSEGARVAVTQSEEIRRVAKEIEKRVEEGIRADGSCSFDFFEVRIALEFALMVLDMHGQSAESN